MRPRCVFDRDPRSRRGKMGRFVCRCGDHVIWGEGSSQFASSKAMDQSGSGLKARRRIARLALAVGGSSKPDAISIASRPGIGLSFEFVKRAAHVWVLAVYLLSQAAFVLHHEEPEHCVTCEQEFAAAFQCANEDCGESGHHHHHGPCEHHAGNCRVCVSTQAAYVEPAPLPVAVRACGWTGEFSAPRTDHSPRLRQSARAPPGVEALAG